MTRSRRIDKPGLGRIRGTAKALACQTGIRDAAHGGDQRR